MPLPKCCCSFLFSVLVLLLSIARTAAAAVLNNAPVIGVLAEPTTTAFAKLTQYGTSFLPSSYVKWLESAGARVVPLPFDLPKDQLQQRLGGLNGVFFPGGDASINNNSPYAMFSRHVFDWATANNIPMWGTCLGFESLFVFTSSLPIGTGVAPILSKVDAEQLFLPLNFTTHAPASAMLATAPLSVMATLSASPATINLHAMSVTPEAVAHDPKLAQQWTILATNVDRHGKTFVSLAESTGEGATMFASQFHPEKNAFEHHQEWDNDQVADMVHTSDAIAMSLWLAQRFVDEARKNHRHYASHDVFTNVSIYNDSPVYLDKVMPGHDLWESAYLFRAGAGEGAGKNSGSGDSGGSGEGAGTATSAASAQQYRPVVIMHGMNNNEHGYNKLIDVLERQYPGIYVTALAVYDDTSSMLTPMDKQLAAVTAAIQSNPKLQSGFNFYGESQGALLARAYVTTSNNPPVHNLVALCGPQAGVGECPTIDGPWKNVCGDLGTDLVRGCWWGCGGVVVLFC